MIILSLRFMIILSFRFSILIKSGPFEGDDFLGESDFLDEISTPAAPDTNPAAPEASGETDEFGLPKIPEASR